MNLKKLPKFLSLLFLAALTPFSNAIATTCANATAITLPANNVSLTCGTSNDISSTTVGPTCGSTLYMGGLEALYKFTPATNMTVEIGYSGQTWSGIFVFQGCPTASTSSCVGNVTSTGSAKTLTVTLTASTQYYIMFDTWPSPASPCSGTFSINTCAAPTAQASSNITQSTAILTTTSTGVTQWQIEYGTTNTLGAASNTRVVTTTNPYTATGLSGSTAYYWWVRNVCGSGDTSAWTGSSNFTTACGTVNTPYTQTFDNTSLPACWALSGPENWLFTTSGPGYGAQGAQDHTNNSGSFAWVDGSGSGSNTGITLSSPIISIATVTNPQLSYYVFSNNTSSVGNNQLIVQALNGTTWITVDSVQQNFTAGWTLRTASLNAVTASTTQIRFIMNEQGANSVTAFYNDILIDDFTVEPAPPCAVPVASAGNITTTITTATLPWTQSTTNGASQWQISYGTLPSTASAGTKIITTTNPKTITGLAAGTKYVWYVRGICSAGDSSVWSAADTFMTDCIPSALPYIKNFNSYPPSSCWSEARGPLTPSGSLVGNKSAWTEDDWLNGPAASNDKAARMNLFGTATQKAWTISAPIDLDSNTYHVLAFDMGIVNHNTTTPASLDNTDTLAVVVSTDNGTTWDRANAVKMFTNANPPTGANGAERYYIPLLGYTGVVKIGWYATNGSASNASKNLDIMIDSVNVSVCNAPMAAIGRDTTLCAGKTITLTSGMGSTYTWSTNATTRSISINSGGTYYVTTTNGNKGCFNKDTVVITGVQKPMVNLGPDKTICNGALVTFDAGNSGSAFRWNTTATTQSITVNTAGAFRVRVTDSNGCIGRDTALVIVNPLPVVNLGPDKRVCAGQPASFDAGNPGKAFLWNTNATTQTITVNTTRNYRVRVTDINGCIGRDTARLTVDPLPIVDLGGDTSVCAKISFVLNAGNPGSSYQWNTGATTRTITVNSNGTFGVGVTTSRGCVGTDTITINRDALPEAGTISIRRTSPAFAFQALNSQNITSHIWFFGDGTYDTDIYPSHSYNTDGTYEIMYVGFNDCGSDTTTKSLLVSSVGIGNVASDQALKVYPNPAQGFAVVESEVGNDLQHLQAINATGQVVIDQALTGNRSTIQLTDMASGLYTLRIQTENGLMIRRLQVQR